MPVGAKPVPESAQPVSAPEAIAIREQLERLLAHPLFANSKRYPVLLAYTVEQTLKGAGSELKERSIGIEVFGRSPSYDANADPVVRITAGEVRKRLMQYYYDSAHSGELIVELPSGSYVPLFRQPETLQPPEILAPAAEADTFNAGVAPATVWSGPVRHLPRRRWLLLAFLFGLALAGSFAIGWKLRDFRDFRPPSSIDRFWAPITEGSATATYCLGEPSKNLDVGSINSLETPRNCVLASLE